MIDIDHFQERTEILEHAPLLNALMNPLPDEDAQSAAVEVAAKDIELEFKIRYGGFWHEAILVPLMMFGESQALFNPKISLNKRKGAVMFGLFLGYELADSRSLAVMDNEIIDWFSKRQYLDPSTEEPKSTSFIRLMLNEGAGFKRRIKGQGEGPWDQLEIDTSKL